MNGHTGRKPKKIQSKKKTKRICKYKHTWSLTASGLQCSHKEPQRHRAHLGGPSSDQSPMSHTSRYPTPGTSMNHDSSSSLVLAAPPTLVVLVSSDGSAARVRSRPRRTAVAQSRTRRLWPARAWSRARRWRCGPEREQGVGAQWPAAGATVVHIVWLLLFRDCIIFF
jgi:hypothetical protein